MNHIWLHGLDWFQPCISAAWRQEYDDWIKQDPEMRGQFGAHPTSTILACPACGHVQEFRGEGAGTTACGHASPNFVRFGEHERQAVQAAIERWEQERKNRRTA